jgi:TIGR00255 family protein
MKSMTGFGRAVAESDGRKVTVELKAVNHRYLDLAVKLPKVLNFTEDAIRGVMKANFSRGHVDVYVTYENKREGAVKLTLDEATAAKYLEIKNALVSRFGVVDDFSATALIRTADVVTTEEEEEDEGAILSLVTAAANSAAEKLNAMRTFEGEKLKNDILTKISTIESLVEKIKIQAPQVVSTYRAKLTERITEALSGVAIDEARLLNEVAFFTDKASVDEEITRLMSHCQHAREILSSPSGEIGRSLDFLIQEFNREANTIGSKSNDITVTNYVLLLKNEIEKVREQVQNAE